MVVVAADAAIATSPLADWVRLRNQVRLQRRLRSNGVAFSFLRYPEQQRGRILRASREGLLRASVDSPRQPVECRHGVGTETSCLHFRLHSDTLPPCRRSASGGRTLVHDGPTGVACPAACPPQLLIDGGSSPSEAGSPYRQKNNFISAQSRKATDNERTLSSRRDHRTV